MADGFDEFSARSVWNEDGPHFVADQLASFGGGGKIEVLAIAVSGVIICRVRAERSVKLREIVLIGFRLEQRRIRVFG